MADVEILVVHNEQLLDGRDGLGKALPAELLRAVATKTWTELRRLDAENRDRGD